MGLATLVAGSIALGAAGTANAQGIDVLGASKQQPNYVSNDMLKNADKDASNWLHYGRDYQSTRYAPQAQINTENVHDLVPKFQTSFGVLEGQDSEAIVVGGNIYVTTSFNRVLSVNGTTGDTNWKYVRELPADVYPELCCDVVNQIGRAHV